MSTTPAPPPTSRTDGEAIDWDNVAVETTVMLRLQPSQKAAATSRAANPSASRREAQAKG